MKTLQFPTIPGNKATINLEYYNTSDSVICDINANDPDELAAMLGVLMTQLLALGYLPFENILGILTVAEQEAQNQNLEKEKANHEKFSYQ